MNTRHTPDKADVPVHCSKGGETYFKAAGTTKPCPKCGTVS
jgi:hypothetical protein